MPSPGFGLYLKGVLSFLDELVQLEKRVERVRRTLWLSIKVYHRVRLCKELKIEVFVPFLCHFFAVHGAGEPEVRPWPAVFERESWNPLPFEFLSSWNVSVGLLCGGCSPHEVSGDVQFMGRSNFQLRHYGVYSLLCFLVDHRFSLLFHCF